MTAVLIDLTTIADDMVTASMERQEAMAALSALGSVVQERSAWKERDAAALASTLADERWRSIRRRIEAPDFWSLTPRQHQEISEQYSAATQARQAALQREDAAIDAYYSDPIIRAFWAINSSLA